MTRITRYVSLCFALLVSGDCLAAGGGITFINYYKFILSAIGLEGAVLEEWKPVAGAVYTLVVTTVLGLLYKKRVSNLTDFAPESRFSIRSALEALMSFVDNLASSIIGEEQARKFLGTLMALFLFILISNLSGLVPGFTPATESLSTNLVLGLYIFIVFNIAGIKEHGLIGYLKTFAGPIALMAPFIFSIEMIGALARPVSLALRLYGNIFGDHLVLNVFTGLTYLVLPAFLLFFGLLVACLQSFVFTLLSSIYISLAVSHDH